MRIMSLLKFKRRKSLIRFCLSDPLKCMYLCIHLIVGVHAYKSVGVHICMGPVQMVVVEGGGSSGGTVGVKHLYGSKPRSGQLQWPMFKVNGGLRWLFISRLLLLCWTPPPPQPPTLLIIFLPYTFSVYRDLPCKSLSTGIHIVLCVIPPSACGHVHMVTHRHLCISRHDKRVKPLHPHALFP